MVSGTNRLFVVGGGGGSGKGCHLDCTWTNRLFVVKQVVSGTNRLFMVGGECETLNMFGMLWIGVYDSVLQFLPISSNFAQPLKRSGPTFHRPQSTT